MYKQMDGEQSNPSLDRDKTYNDNLEMLRDLCDSLATTNGISREDVLKRLMNFATLDESYLFEICRFSSSSSQDDLSDSSSVHADNADNTCPNCLTIQCPGGLHIPDRHSISVAEQEVVPQERHGHSESSLKRRRTNCTTGKRTQHLNAFDPVENFFLQHISDNPEAAAVCATLVKTVGQSNALHKLGLVLASLRNNDDLPRLNSGATIQHIWLCLEKAETETAVAVYLRRVYLLQFLDRYEESSKDRGLHDSPCIADRNPGSPLTNLTRTKALDCLTRQTLPAINHSSREAFEKHRKKVKNIISCARKWARLAREYSDVITFLVPTGSEFGMNSQKFEYLKNEHIDVLIEGIQEFRNPWLANMCEKLEDYVMSTLRGQNASRHMRFEIGSPNLLNDNSLTDEELLSFCEMA